MHAKGTTHPSFRSTNTSCSSDVRDEAATATHPKPFLSNTSPPRQRMGGGGRRAPPPGDARPHSQWAMSDMFGMVALIITTRMEGRMDWARQVPQGVDGTATVASTSPGLRLAARAATASCSASVRTVEADERTASTGPSEQSDRCARGCVRPTSRAQHLDCHRQHNEPHPQ